MQHNNIFAYRDDEKGNLVEAEVVHTNSRPSQLFWQFAWSPLVHQDFQLNKSSQNQHLSLQPVIKIQRYSIIWIDFDMIFLF